MLNIFDNTKSKGLPYQAESRNAPIQKNNSFIKFILSITIVLGSFASMAQVISIGLPADGTEGTLDVFFEVSIDGGALNTTGSDITGTVVITGTSTVVDDYTDVVLFAIPNGENSVVVNVPIIDDFEVEVDETIIATISAPSSGTVSAQNSSSATVFDDDNAELLINLINPIDGVEGTSDAQFTVHMYGFLTNGTGGDITGDLTYTGTAQDGVDFTSTASFGIPDGGKFVDITLPIIDDMAIEDSEPINVTVSNVNFGAVGPLDSLTAFILDDESPLATMSITLLNDGIEGETPTDIAFTVSLDNGVFNGVGADIVGELTLSGTAEVDLDYLDVITFNIPEGENEIVVYIPVVDNSIIEANESVIAEISNPSLGMISTMNEAIANIIDDDLIEGDHLNYIVSPNNDGENDLLVMLGLDNFVDNHLKIYNRWGNVVFDAKGYQNDWGGESVGGDPTFGSGLLPNGTYFYTLDMGTNGNTNKGYIELRR